MRLWLSLLFLSSLGFSSAAESARPNVLLIYADDQSYKTVGCYPESWPWVKTPNIDALAKTGVRFHAAYLGSWCMPSRASILTGRHPHGIESMTMEGKYPGSTYDPTKCRFAPAEMRKQGYHTAQIGKWHTGTDSGWARDWDRQIVWNRPLHPENAGAYYETQIVSEDGVERTQEGYPADNYTKWATDYIKGEKRDKSKPWYLWLCYGSIHGPSKPAARHKGMYKDGQVPLPKDIFPPRSGKPAYLNKTQSWIEGEDGMPIAKKGGEAFGEAKRGLRFDDWVRQMNECLPAVDEGVGQLVQTLKETGQYDNTVVIYTADQGFGMGEHGFRTKLAPYDTNYRSPLIVSMPSKIAQDKVCPQAINGPDLVATILSFMQVTVPWPLHGRDITLLLKQPQASWEHPVLYEHMDRLYGADARTAAEARSGKTDNQVPRYAAVVLGGWKYIHYLDTQSGEELYDLKTDPDELNNLAANPEHKAKLTSLRTAMESELQRTEGFALK
ncbi:MAG: sulfatase-like hydrolase/transferase [Verrucomicrobiaceae bacterium]|nr:sulfatase-like hydrolase/transferase [Verrucomicrobiaceae bacterium]